MLSNESDKTYAKLFIDYNRQKEIVRQYLKTNNELNAKVTSLESQLEAKDTLSEQRKQRIYELERELEKIRPLASQTESQIDFKVNSEVSKAIRYRDQEWTSTLEHEGYPNRLKRIWDKDDNQIHEQK